MTNYYHIDDNPFDLDKISKLFSSQGLSDSRLHSFTEIKIFKEALAKRKAENSIFIVDLEMPELGGLNQNAGLGLIKFIKTKCNGARIYIYSHLNSPEVIAEALDRGAFDFVCKAEDEANIAELFFAQPTPKSDDSNLSNLLNQGFIGKHLRELSFDIQQICNSAVTCVLVGGESGTGKEKIADLFHLHSPKSQPFIRLNCAEFTPTLLRSELFGHVKGAFTGATHHKVGLIEKAKGGWLFLDEIAELDKEAQASLLRVIENAEVRAVGATTGQKIDLKILCATHQNLDTMVEEGEFRNDLFQRIREESIALKPLRERKDEIIPLTSHFLHNFKGGPYRISESALTILQNQNWRRGNIRELRNCLRAMTARHVDKFLSVSALPKRLFQAPKDQSSATKESSHSSLLSINIEGDRDFESVCDELLYKWCVKLSDSRKATSLRELSKALNISRNTLTNRLRRHCKDDDAALQNLGIQRLGS